MCFFCNLIADESWSICFWNDSMNVLMVWCTFGGIHVLLVGGLNLMLSSLVYSVGVLPKWALSLSFLLKFKISLLNWFLSSIVGVGMKLKLYPKSLYSYTNKGYFERFVTLPYGSVWYFVVDLIVYLSPAMFAWCSRNILTFFVCLVLRPCLCSGPLMIFFELQEKGFLAGVTAAYLAPHFSNMSWGRILFVHYKLINFAITYAFYYISRSFTLAVQQYFCFFA